jgi:hypothetical protein
MDERDYKAMNSENNSLGNLSEIAVEYITNVSKWHENRHFLYTLL